MKLSDYLEELDEEEILSLNYEGCVGVKGNKVIQYGEVIDTLNTVKKAKKLFNELLEGMY